MSQAEKTGCINHPTIPAAVRCKQCAQPACTKCVVLAPFGRFCSELCRDQYQDFQKKAQAAQIPGKPSPFRRLRRFVKKAVVLLVALVTLGVAGMMVEIPVLSRVVRMILVKIGL